MGRVTSTSVGSLLLPLLRVEWIFTNWVHCMWNLRFHFVLLRRVHTTLSWLVLWANQLHISWLDACTLIIESWGLSLDLTLEGLLILHSERKIRLVVLALVRNLYKCLSLLLLLLIQILLLYQVLAVASWRVTRHLLLWNGLATLQNQVCFDWDLFDDGGLVSRATCLSRSDPALVSWGLLLNCVVGWGDLLRW